MLQVKLSVKIAKIYFNSEVRWPEQILKLILIAVINIILNQVKFCWIKFNLWNVLTVNFLCIFIN